MPRRFLLPGLLAVLLSAPLLAGPRLEFSPPEVKYGMVDQGARVRQDVTVTNLEAGPLTVTFVSTCECLEVTPGPTRIAGGARAVFHVVYDSTDDHGVVSKSFLVTTDAPADEPVRYWLSGTVRQRGSAEPSAAASVRTAAPADPTAGNAGSGSPLVVVYYYTPGCRSCEEFLSVEIPRLEKTVGRRIEVVRRDLLASGSWGELSAFAASKGRPVTSIPALRAADVLLQGEAEIRTGLPGVLALMAGPVAGSVPAPVSESAPASAVEPAPAPVTDRLAVLPVVVAGLIDGINPCAFTTLIFLLASLALAGRSRREIFVIGALFSVAVYVSYFLVGLGFFSALRALSAVSVVSVLLRWVLVAVLLVFAGLSVYDYTLIRAGRPSDMVLQLPASFKKRIHASIRTRVRVAALAGSSLVLGFLVSMFEFACTGQVYLPLLGYLARMHRQPDAVALLALYNLCFIAPLLVVFGASWLGVSSGRITVVFQAHMGKVKIGLAVVFIGLAAFTLVG